MENQGALAELDTNSVMQRIAAGEFAADIAKELGVNKSSLYRKLQSIPDYKKAREIAWESRLDDATQEFDRDEAAKDPCILARARERFRAIAWRAEREFPERWGRTDKLQVEQVGDLGDRLRRSKSRIIDVTPETVGVSLGVSADKRTDESDNNQ